MSEDTVTVFVCGPPKDHQCNDDGPFIYFLSDGSITTDRNKAGVGCTGGSVTCSVCGMSAMEKSLWEGP